MVTHLNIYQSFTLHVEMHLFDTGKILRRATLNGFVVAFTGAAVYCIYAATWRLAGHLVIQEKLEVFEVFR